METLAWAISACSTRSGHATLAAKLGAGTDMPRNATTSAGTGDADGPGTGAARPDNAARSFALCADLLRSGHPDAAAVLDHCLRRHPADAPGWRLLGDALAGARRFEAALVCFERSRRADPSAEVALRVGTALQALGRAAEARMAFAEAAGRDPASVRARFLEGVAAQDAGDLAGAAAAYEAALSLDPTLGEAALNLGAVRQEMGHRAEARRAFGRAIGLRPDSFGRAAQAMTTARSGELWLDLGALRRHIAGGG